MARTYARAPHAPYATQERLASSDSARGDLPRHAWGAAHGRKDGPRVQVSARSQAVEAPGTPLYSPLTAASLTLLLDGTAPGGPRTWKRSTHSMTVSGRQRRFQGKGSAKPLKSWKQKPAAPSV